MEHRRLPNKPQMFEIVQDQNQIPLTAEHAYNHIGRAAAPQNGSFLYLMDNLPMSGVHCAFQEDLESRPVEHSSSTFRLEGPRARTSVSGPYNDRFSHFPAAGNIYPTTGNNASHVYSSCNNRYRTHEVESGLLDPMMGNGRGSLKRKRPGISVGCERGSTSRLNGAGSSSNSSELHLEKRTLDSQIYRPSCNGLPHHRVGSFSIGGVDAPRNVRSRSRLDLGSNPRRTHLSSHPSHHYHSKRADISNLNAAATALQQNCIAVPPATHGRSQSSENNVLSHEMNRSLVGSTSEIGGYRRDSISNRNTVLPQYLHGPRAQGACEGRSNYSQRAMPPYRAGLNFPHLGHEVAPYEHGLHSLSGSSSSRYSRPSSAGGQDRNYRNGRSRIAIERFQSPSIAANARDRMASEAAEMVDRSLLYNSRNLPDQYRDMRLDIDNMGYEELLALGERIGNVSTGLSEDAILKCLIKTTFSDENQESCAICLEDYKNNEEVVSMRNCGHVFHLGCIKKWLSMKNLCPICKAPALADSL